MRVNALSAGPLKTLASSAVGAKGMEELYAAVAPMGRNVTHDEVGRIGAFCCPPCRMALPRRSFTSMRAITQWARRGECSISSNRKSATDADADCHCRRRA